MTARTSMQPLVDKLRSVTGASPDDEFLGSVYWTDDQLQDILDGQRVSVWAVSLTPIRRLLNGNSVSYQTSFPIPRGYWIEPVFTVRNSNGVQIVSPTYTVAVTENEGTVTFEADVLGSTMTLDYSAYDWNAAAADVWDQKAAHRYDYVNIKTADHKFDLSAEYQHCVDRAAYHRARKIKSFHRPDRGFVVGNQGRYRP